MASILAGVVQPNYANCDDAPVGGPIEVPVEGPPGPPGPPGPANNRFAFVFVFGNSLSEIIFGSRVVCISPYTGSVRRWRSRNAGDVAASVAFEVRSAPDVLGALTSVGGTQPAISAAKGAEDLAPDWTITNIVAGQVIEAELVSGDTLGVTLVIECEVP